MPDVNVGSVDGIPEGEVISVEVGDREIAVAREGDSFYVFVNECTHKHCTFDDAEVEDGVLTCACHGSKFDLATGDVVDPPATEPIDVFPVHIEGGNVVASIE
ncbi:MAG TPA: Rieske 2Fe-2S domain-containing protein [Actinomycetota bacterium]